MYRFFGAKKLIEFSEPKTIFEICTLYCRTYKTTFWNYSCCRVMENGGNIINGYQIYVFKSVFTSYRARVFVRVCVCSSYC